MFCDLRSLFQVKSDRLFEKITSEKTHDTGEPAPSPSFLVVGLLVGLLVVGLLVVGLLVVGLLVVGLLVVGLLVVGLLAVVLLVVGLLVVGLLVVGLLVVGLLVVLLRALVAAAAGEDHQRQGHQQCEELLHGCPSPFTESVRTPTPLAGARRTRCASSPFIPNFFFPSKIPSADTGTKQKRAALSHCETHSTERISCWQDQSFSRRVDGPTVRTAGAKISETLFMREQVSGNRRFRRSPPPQKKPESEPFPADAADGRGGPVRRPPICPLFFTLWE